MNYTKIDFSQRNVGIDLFRALTMFVMIFVNDFWKIHDVPRWLDHAKHGEDFLGLADVVFPCFLIAVGLSIPFAIERRYSKGMSGESTIGHILARTLALLIMGAFITNSEARLSPDVSYRIGVYWILMVTAFIFIWNYYPRTDNPNGKKLNTLLNVIGVIILLYLAVTFRNPDGGVFGARWGILGSIGWTYLLCAFIYVFTRDRLKYLIPIWLVFVIICILGSRMNTAWGETAILSLPRPNFYNEMLRILHIGNGALPAFTLGGVILSLISTKYRQVPILKRTVYAIVAIAIFLLAGIISRQFWILAKLGATPTWVFFVTAISIGTYAILSWLAEIGKASWFNVIKPAGTATLTCYLIPYVWYGLADITGYILPDWFTHGFMGIVKCLCFALIIVGITYLLGRIHIKLKI
jgi:heparan-alpha-glucosaminide N-acetyltransferase